jgi:hypothetical protein
VLHQFRSPPYYSQNADPRHLEGRGCYIKRRRVLRGVGRWSFISKEEIQLACLLGTFEVRQNQRIDIQRTCMHRQGIGRKRRSCKYDRHLSTSQYREAVHDEGYSCAACSSKARAQAKRTHVVFVVGVDVNEDKMWLCGEIGLTICCFAGKKTGQGWGLTLFYVSLAEGSVSTPHRHLICHDP